MFLLHLHYELQLEETDWRRENIGCTDLFVTGRYSIFFFLMQVSMQYYERKTVFMFLCLYECRSLMSFQLFI